MENFVDKQIKFNTIINKIIVNNKLSHAYILVSENDELLRETSMLLSKVVICPKSFSKQCNVCNICKRIDNDEYLDLRIVNPVNNIIKKKDIIDLRDSFVSNSLEGKNMVYIINKAEYLGVSAANSILKFLEEPDINCVGIFTTNNLSNVLDTIKSRCQIIKLNNNIKDSGYDYVKKYCNCNDELINYAIEFVYEIEKNTKKVITKSLNEAINFIDSRQMLLSFMNVLLFIYFDKLNMIVLKQKKYFMDNNNFDKIIINDKDIILEKMIYILKQIEKLDCNVNIMLFLSNFIIEIGELGNG